MATSKAREDVGEGSANMGTEFEQSRGRSDGVGSIHWNTKTYAPVALALVGWSLFWFLTLRILFIQERLLEVAVGAGLLLLPIVGFLGWMWWTVRHPESS